MEVNPTPGTNIPDLLRNKDFQSTFPKVTLSLIKASYQSNLPASDFRDALSPGQVLSKHEMTEKVRSLERLMREPASLIVLYQAGWFGLGPLWLLDAPCIPLSRVYSMDKDPDCVNTAQHIAATEKRQRLQPVLGDVLDETSLVFAEDRNVNLVINTSLEHFDITRLISSLKKYSSLPSVRGLYLQATNLPAPDHRWEPTLETFKKAIYSIVEDMSNLGFVEVRSIPLHDDYTRYEAVIFKQKDETWNSDTAPF